MEKFPKVTTKDPLKLKRFSRPVIREDGYLADSDTSRGINPIIEKLPHNIQENWLYFGTKYKCENVVSFPPFSVLVDFIHTEAKAHPDPSFKLFIQASAERKNKWERPTKTVCFHKTQVSTSLSLMKAGDQLTQTNIAPCTKSPTLCKNAEAFLKRA